MFLVSLASVGRMPSASSLRSVSGSLYRVGRAGFACKVALSPLVDTDGVFGLRDVCMAGVLDGAQERAMDPPGRAVLTSSCRCALLPRRPRPRALCGAPCCRSRRSIRMRVGDTFTTAATSTTFAWE